MQGLADPRTQWGSAPALRISSGAAMPVVCSLRTVTEAAMLASSHSRRTRATISFETLRILRVAAKRKKHP